MKWSLCSSRGVATIDCIPLLIVNFIYWGIILGGSVAVIFIIVGGVRFILSGGDPKKLDQSKKTIGFAILGLFLIFLSFFIVNLIAQTTGVACISPNFPLDPIPFETCK